VLHVMTPPLLMLGAGDIALIVLIFAVLFGGKKIPELAKGLGQGIRNFKGAVKSDEDAAETKEEKKKIE
jgi:sec-independent protein translocase protein TatA